MIRILTLTPDNTTIKGEYSYADTVLAKCNAVNLAFTVSLPDATNSRNVNLIFKKTDSSENVITIAGINSQTIDGATTKTLSTQYALYSIVSDGNNWNII